MAGRIAQLSPRFTTPKAEDEDRTPEPRKSALPAGSHRRMQAAVPIVVTTRRGKVALLLILCLQNTVYTMLRRYSVGVRNEEWSSSSVLMVGEIIKLAISLLATSIDTRASSSALMPKLGRVVRSSHPMAVPAGIFWLMNLLSYWSLARIDASTFTVCCQMKILATAMFSVFLMGRSFSQRKWKAMILMVLGVALVATAAHPASEDDDQKDLNLQFSLGVVAVLVQVALSGFAGVFFEKVLKSKVTDLSVWDRNVQLALYSILFYLPITVRDTGPALFHGWTWNAVILSILGSGGGLLVALITKYADAVLKTFATSGAIIVTAVAGYFLIDGPLNTPIAVGAACTVLSLMNYGESDTCEACEKGRAKALSSHNQTRMPHPPEEGSTPESGLTQHADVELAKPLLVRSTD